VEKPPNYGIDTTTAGTSQERYFMVLAGLMQKSLELDRAILDQLLEMNKGLAPKVTEIDTKSKRDFEFPPLDGVPQRQGKKAR
jgi:hypothetical protein